MSDKGSPYQELIWVDIETTGLEPDQGRPLEIGVMVTRPDLFIVSQQHFFVGPVPTEEEIATWPEAVQKMHADSNLLRAMRIQRMLAGQMPSAEEVDFYLFDWLSRSYPEGNLMLAGSSVEFDRRWMKAHFPKTAALFHYRAADVSAMRELLRRWFPTFDKDMESAPEPSKKHRSMSDLLDSLELAAFMQGYVKRSPAFDPEE